MNVYKKTSLGVLVVILILSVVAVFLISTDRGLHILFNVTSHWIPGLEIGQISGNLHNLYLKNIIYVQPGLIIKTGESHLVTKINCLRKGRLCIETLALENINIETDMEKFSKLVLEKEEKKINNSINFLKKYPIALNRVILHNANIRINDTVLSVKNFTSDLCWQKKNLTLDSTLLQGLLISLSKTEKFPKRNIVESTIQQFRLGERSFKEVLQIFFSQFSSLKMKDIRLPFNLEIREFKGEYLRLIHPSTNIDFIIYNMLMKIKSIDSDICLSKLHVDSNQGTFNIIANTQLYGDWPVHIIFNSVLNIHSLQNEKIRLTLKGVLTKQIEMNINLSGPVDMDLNAKIYAYRTREVSSLLQKLDKNKTNLTQAYRTFENPSPLIDLTIKSFCWRKLFIDSIHIYGYAKSVDQIYGKLNVRAEGIIKSGLNIRLVTLEIAGNEKQHNLQLSMYGKPISGKLHLTGYFNRKGKCWRGQLDNILFDAQIGFWKLIRSFPRYLINIEKKISTESHDWNNLGIKFCIPQTINVGSENYATINIRCFDLEIFKSLASYSMHISGIFRGKTDITWNFDKGGDFLQSKMTFSGNDIKIVRTVCRRSFPTILHFLNLKVSMSYNHIEFVWLIHLTNSINNSFHGKIQISDLHGHRNLNGNISISNLNLTTTCDTDLSRTWKMQGILSANLQFFGNIEYPKVFGQININNVNINGNFTPFDIQSNRVTINFKDIHSTFEVEVTQQGLMHLNGDIDWRKIKNWRVHASIKGSRIYIAIPPMIHFDISSDIIFEITPILFTFKGYIDVPWARIVVHESLENFAEVFNKDKILLNENMKPIKSESAQVPINGNLTVRIGNNVRIDAFGINANLVGDIKATQNKKRLDLRGHINVSEGSFHSYGQDFLIRKGELFFPNASSLQPFLNIEAIRNPETTENNIVVGIRITGMINALKVEIFSEPIMSQQDILSYLLHGQKINSNQQDNITLASILIGFWIKQSSQVINKIGEILHINNLTLDTLGIGDATQLVISGHILPDLQIKYDVGIFNTLKTLTLRYYLIHKRLYLEIISNMYQKVLDLVYRCEF